MFLETLSNRHFLFWIMWMRDVPKFFDSSNKELQKDTSTIVDVAVTSLLNRNITDDLENLQLQKCSSKEGNRLK